MFMSFETPRAKSLNYLNPIYRSEKRHGNVKAKFFDADFILGNYILNQSLEKRIKWTRNA